MTIKEAYSILGLNEITLDAGVLLKAKREQLQKWHPDHNPSPDASFRCQQILEAWEVIKDYITSQETASDVEEEENESFTDHSYQTEQSGEQSSAYGFHDDSAWDNLKSKVSDGYDKFMNETKWYEVILNIHEGIRIPKICPVCLKPTEEQITLTAMATTGEVISSRRSRTTWHSSEIPFFCCCSKKELSKYVKLSRDEYSISIYFRNKDYAELFADINNLEIYELSAAEKAADKVKEVANDAVQNAVGSGCLQALGTPLLLGIIFLFIKACSI